MSEASDVALGIFGCTAFLSCIIWAKVTISAIMPEWTSLLIDADGIDDYENTYAKDYKRYFVGVGRTSGHSNNSWWNWSYDYRHLYDIEATNGFVIWVDSGDDLKNACSRAYKGTLQTEGEYKGKIIESEVNKTLGHVIKYTERDIWRFCSPIGQKPTTTSMDEHKYESNQIGGGSNKDKLISVKDSLNDGFWEIRQNEFFEPSGDFSGTNGIQGKFFRKLYEDNKDRWRDNRPSVKDECAEAYSRKSTDDNGDITEEEVVKFCSL